MWCYDPSALGLLGVEVASNGFNVAITGSTADAAGQLVQSTAQRGLLVGRHGFCKLWFTSDAYVASTLGVACAVLVLLIVYGIAMNTR
jgi:F0F1-type ATP synthase membrane subunit a